MTLPNEARPVNFILTADRQRSRPFYADVLGLPVLSDEQFGVVFDLGSGATMRLTDLPDHKPSEHTVMGWEVADLDSALTELLAKGVEPLIYEGFGQDAQGIWTAPGGGAKLVWFADPEGNVLSIAQHD